MFVTAAAALSTTRGAQWPRDQAPPASRASRLERGVPGPLVVVEDEAQRARAAHHAERLGQVLARRAVGANDDDETVHQVAQDADVGERQRRGGVEEDVVVALA